MKHRKFVDRLEEWFEENRRSFFWRQAELNPFQILLTELLLKRTRAETVDKHCKEFVIDNNSPSDIIEIGQDRLKEELKVLGLYERRSKNIHNVSSALIEEYGGKVPESKKELLSISGIGQYSADAVLCHAYNRNVIPIDINVARVIKEYFDVEIPEDIRDNGEIKKVTEVLLEETSDPKELHWALVDLGARINKEEDPLDLF